MKRRDLCGIAVLATAALVFTAIRAISFEPGNGRPSVSELTPQLRSASTTLIVMIHGYTGSPEGLAGQIETIESMDEFRDADLMVPRIEAGWFSNACLADVAETIETKIKEAFRARRYDRIILVGHSVGALLIRKAFVLGHEGLNASGPATGSASWVEKVDRIVLLAGMNRGWSFSPRPENMSWPTQRMNQAGMALAGLTRTGQFIRDAERGAPFVADLRVEWLRLSRERTLPPVIQLLGRIDDVVSRDDNMDVAVAKRFYFLPLRDTGHGSILEFGDDELGSERRAAFKLALRGDSDLLGDATERFDVPEIPGIENVVFVMHGIRDHGDWVAKLGRAIEAGHDETVAVTSHYGYFPMLGFLLLHDRQENVRWFMDQYTEAMAKYPDAKRFSFVGHSNGTYLLAAALERYRALTIHNVVFAGSVVPRAFDWTGFRRARQWTGKLRNYVGSADWVVGIFPHLFEFLGRGDIGSAGFFGFEDPAAHDDEVRFVDAGHGGVLDASEHIPAVVDFVYGTPMTVPAVVEERDRVVYLLSRLCWLVWLLLVGCLAWTGRSATRVLKARLQWRLRWTIPAYAALILLLLHSI